MAFMTWATGSIQEQGATLFIRMWIADVSGLPVFVGCFYCSANTNKMNHLSSRSLRVCTPCFLCMVAFMQDEGALDVMEAWALWPQSSKLVEQLHCAAPVPSSSLFHIEMSPFYFAFPLFSTSTPTHSPSLSWPPYLRFQPQMSFNQKPPQCSCICELAPQ